MIKINWDLNGKEKKRILNLHESATKRQYLLKETKGEKKEDFPKCVQSFGEPVLNSSGFYQIFGTGDWEGYNFTLNKYYDPNTQSGDGNYYCSANRIVLGDYKNVTAKGAENVSDDDSNWDIIKNGEKVIAMGATGPLVQSLQHELAKNGWGDEVLKDKIGGVGCADDATKCDGKFGQSTKAAVMDFQKWHKLSADGIFGQQLSSIYWASPSKPDKFPDCILKKSREIKTQGGHREGKFIEVNDVFKRQYYADGYMVTEIPSSGNYIYPYSCNADGTINYDTSKAQKIG